MPPAVWPKEIGVGGGGIRSQTGIVRELINCAIEECELEVVTKNAFPEVENRAGFRTRILLTASAALERKHADNPLFRMLHQRVDLDQDFRQVIGEFVSLTAPALNLLSNFTGRGSYIPCTYTLACSGSDSC